MPARNVKCHGNAMLVINTEHPLKPNVMRQALQMNPNDKNATEETERSQDRRASRMDR